LREYIREEVLKHDNKGDNRRISTERIVSGPGICTLYDFYKSRHPNLGEDLSSEITSVTAQIIDQALNHQEPICLKALNLFVTHYGSELGDYCLKLNPTGGLYILGGVTLGSRDHLLSPESGFLKNIMDKGRVTELVEAIPIYILKREIGLDGAEMYAV
jgi:glucokinase